MAYKRSVAKSNGMTVYDVCSTDDVGSEVRTRVDTAEKADLLIHLIEMRDGKSEHPGDPLPFGPVADLLILLHKDLSPATRTSYLQNLNNHLAPMEKGGDSWAPSPYLGTCDIREVTLTAFEELVKYIGPGGQAPAHPSNPRIKYPMGGLTVVLNIAHIILGYARDDFALIDEVPTLEELRALVDLHKVNVAGAASNRDWPKPTETDRICLEILNRWGLGPAVFTKLLAWGLEYSEAAGIRAMDVDLGAGMLHLRVRLVGRELVPLPLSRRRSIQLEGTILDELAALVGSLSPDLPPESPVFHTKRGDLLYGVYYRRTWLHPACDTLKMRRVNPSDFRNASVKLLADAGVPENDIRYHLGVAQGRLRAQYPWLFGEQFDTKLLDEAFEASRPTREVDSLGRAGHLRTTG